MEITFMPQIRPQDLIRAVENDELEFWYQPKVSFLTGRVSGCEALIRWRQPDGSVLLPGSFLPQAEEAGLVTEIAKHMFSKLCLDQRKLVDAFGAFHVAFNVTADDLENPDMVALILSAVHSGLVQANQIQVELTETAVAQNAETLQASIEALVEAGVALAMDDFGTGYSSLDTLHRLPFSVVKIDREVINGLTHSGRCAAIALASIRMAHEMDLKVVAEGVETEEVFEYLLHAGCTEAQGFWISEPLPLDELIGFVAQGRRWCSMPIGLLRHVEIDHIRWRKAVMDRVLGVKSSGLVGSLDAIGISPYRCRFGQWFYGIGRDFVGKPGFDALEEPHRKLHQVGARLLQASSEGVPDYAIRSMTAELNYCSEELLRLLQDLEIDALLTDCQAR
ncbi:MAG: EAL domain-containing protein [Planctomycetes bacterium]|nr:EAL domain-containing protein [Planctomycetota bacterium]